MNSIAQSGFVTARLNKCKKSILHKYRGLHSTEVADLLLTQQTQVQFSAFQRILLLMLLRFIDSSAKNRGLIMSTKPI